MREAITELDHAGHVVYLVGGCVRDFLLNKVPKDYDLVTSATPDEILGLFPNGLDIGKKFGVVKLPPDLEIATFRADGEYSDGRHPDHVTFGDPFSDVLRRDFTVNGLLLDFKSKRVLDAVGGLEDLKAGILRAIGDPAKRLKEDSLRVLRAARFSARLGFPIETTLEAALRESVKRVRKVSHERLRDELERTLLGDHSARGFALLKELGILAEILPEAERLSDRVWRCFEAGLRPRDPSTAWSPELAETVLWALLFSGVGREDRVRKLQSLGDRFRLSRALHGRVEFCVNELPKFREVFGMREATLVRWVSDPTFPALLELHRVLAQAREGDLFAYGFCRGLRARALADAAIREKILTGADLIELGLPPGRSFAQILTEVEDLQLEGKLRSKREAIEFVLERYVR